VGHLRYRPDVGRTGALDSHALHDDAFADEPDGVWRHLRDHAPVFHDAIDDVFVLTRHDDVRWAFTEAVGLSNRVYGRTVGKVFGRSMLEMDGYEHVHRRTIVAPQMVGKRLASYASVITSVADRVVAEALHAAADGPGSFDLVDQISHRVPGTVIATMLGLPTDDHPTFFGWYNAMMAGLWTDAELRRRGHAAHLAFQEYLAPIIAERSQQPGADLISRLLHAEVSGERLAPDDIASFVSLLLVAGGETTDKAISNLWWLLLTHPDEYAAVRADPERLQLVFSETMRLYPSLIYLGREALHDVERHGTTIPAGSVLRLAVGSANRDERVFADPDRFWPDRPDLHRGKELRAAPSGDGWASHIAFGAGAHFCIGYELARMETVAASRSLLARLGPSPRCLSDAGPRTRPPSRVVDSLVVEPDTPDSVSSAWAPASG
jgi:cytochrome P450